MLTKIALLLLLLVVVFYGGRAMARLSQAAPGRGPGRGSGRAARRDTGPPATETQLQECPRCGAFVPGGDCDCQHGR